MSAADTVGKLKQQGEVSSAPGDNKYSSLFVGVVSWSGAGTTNGDTLRGIAVGTIGVNNDMASTANVYWYNSLGEWKDTTQTVAGFFGV